MMDNYYIIIDRIEKAKKNGKDYLVAVCEKEDRSMITLPLSKLPSGSKEGSLLKVEGGIYTLQDNTHKKEHMRHKMKQLFKNSDIRDCRDSSCR